MGSERTGPDGGHGREELTQQQLFGEDLLDVLLALHGDALEDSHLPRDA